MKKLQNNPIQITLRTALLLMPLAALFFSPCHGQEARIDPKPNQQLEASLQEQVQIPLKEQISLRRSSDDRAWWSEYRAWFSAVGWPIVAVIVAFILRPIISRSEEITLKGMGGEIVIKSPSEDSASIAKALLNETFSRVRDLTNEQVRILYMVLRVQRYKQSYEIPIPSGDRDNEFHNNLRALRQANLVHPVEGGAFKQGRHAQATPWGVILADRAQGGIINLKTPQEKKWKAIGAEISKREIKDIIEEMNKKAILSPA